MPLAPKRVKLMMIHVSAQHGPYAVRMNTLPTQPCSDVR